MRALLINPVFPMSFFSFKKSVHMLGKKTMLPPLGLITVAALLPEDWEFLLVDRNIRQVSEEEWDWAEIVLLSAMNVQREDFAAQITEAKQRNKLVMVGGPYTTSYTDEVVNTEADYLVLDEGEITVPMFLDALNSGKQQRIFRAEEKPDITNTPVPRFDLLELDAYADMSVQFSRGCPFLCEFCDIIVLYGRKPRTKTSDQMIRELEFLYQLGWRGNVFLVDDNFIGNKKNVLTFLQHLETWQSENNAPFSFYTEASVNLAKEEKLLKAMTAANFRRVFMGIETPDVESLAKIRKTQNLGDSLNSSMLKIHQAGLEIWAGMIIGFDGEKAGAGQRIVELIEDTSVPLAFLNMLQVLPNTALWDRLEKEDRILSQTGDVNQTTLLNFVPTRPAEEIVDEYLQAFWHLYEPRNYMERAFSQLMKIGTRAEVSRRRASVSYRVILMLIQLVFRQGVLWPTRWIFWRYIYLVARHDTSLVSTFIGRCVMLEHFLECRQIVTQKITDAMAVRTKEGPIQVVHDKAKISTVVEFDNHLTRV